MTTRRIPTCNELAGEERRWARKHYRSALRYEQEAIDFARHADLCGRLADTEAADGLRFLAAEAPERAAQYREWAAQYREWARNCNARARRYEEMTR